MQCRTTKAFFSVPTTLHRKIIKWMSVKKVTTLILNQNVCWWGIPHFLSLSTNGSVSLYIFWAISTIFSLLPCVVTKNNCSVNNCESPLCTITTMPINGIVQLTPKKRRQKNHKNSVFVFVLGARLPGTTTLLASRCRSLPARGTSNLPTQPPKGRGREEARSNP